jgi:hypothetical protein
MANSHSSLDEWQMSVKEHFCCDGQDRETTSYVGKKKYLESVIGNQTMLMQSELQ